MFLEMFLLNIRGNTVKFASRVKRLQNDEENKLQKEIENLESKESKGNLELINSKKEKLQEIRKSKLQGFIIRSRVQNILLNEKPSKFFCNLEKSKYIDKTIKKITMKNGEIINTQKDIPLQVKNLYADLFCCKDNKEKNMFDLHSLVSNSRKLTPDESNKLNGPLTVTELSNVLKNIENNKTPGLDGLPADFYKMFWSYSFLY